MARPTLGQAMPEFYDTHAHLDFPDFREEVDEVVQRAADAGISRIVTIGTELESSRRAIDLAKAAGAKRALLLPVSAPFHCALMAPAAEEMANALAEVDMQAPTVPVVANVIAKAVSDPAEIRELLIKQVTGQVRWMSSIEWMSGQGATEIWEIGAGKALSGMIRRIDKNLATVNIGTAADVAAMKPA